MNVTLVSIFLGIAGMFGWGLYDFLGGVFAKQIGPFRSLFWSQLAGLGTVGLLAFVFAPILNSSGLAILLIAVAAILYSAGYLFFFKGLEIGNISIVAVAMNLWAVFTMLFAFLFMGQRLSGIQTLGVTLILAGVAVASLNWNDIKNQRFQFSVGVKETVAGAFFFGIFWNVSEIVSEEIGWLFTTLFVKLGIILFLLIFSFVTKREIGFANVPAKTKPMLVVMGIVEAGAVAAVNYGLTIGDAILITPIASALSIVTIGLAILFLKDKITKFQGFGIFMAIVGIITTAF